MSDIKKARPDLMQYATQYCVDATDGASGKGHHRKHMKKDNDAKLDTSVMKWYVQQRSWNENFVSCPLACH